MHIPHQELASWNRATDLVYAAGLAVRALTGAVWYSPRLLWYLWDTLVAGLKGLNKPDLDYDPTPQEILRPSDWDDHRNHLLRQVRDQRAQQAEAAAGAFTWGP
jgi:hypothetical protein